MDRPVIRSARITGRMAVASVAVAAGAIAFAAGAGAVAPGAGAELPAAAYSHWCTVSALCTYKIADPAGLHQLRSGEATWVGDDEELPPHEVAQAGGPVAYYPTMVTALAVAANLPDGDGRDLKLTHTAIAGMFSGTVTRWNDPAIRVSNRHRQLPRNLKITLCVPGDVSGTNWDMSEWLSEVSPSFRKRVGASESPRWRAAKVVRAANTSDTGECLADNPGAVTFLTVADAQREGLTRDIARVGKTEKVTYAAKGGKTKTRTEWVFTSPTEQAMVLAADHAGHHVKGDLTIDLTNSPAKGAYPITVEAYALVRKDRKMNAATRKAIGYFLSDEAQAMLPALGYAPTPPSLLKKARAQLARAR